MIKRREFITTLGAAAAWPLAAQAQQARMPVLGFLGSAAEADYKTTTAAVSRGLSEAGWGGQAVIGAVAVKRTNSGGAAEE